MNAWKQYKARVNSNAQLWIVDISNTKVSNVDLNDPSIVVYNSITPAIFNNLNYVGMDIVDAVRSFDIDGFINDDNGKYETASTPKPKRKAPGYSYPSQYE